MSNPEAPSPTAAPAPMRTLLGMKEPGKPGHIVVWDTAEVSLGRAPENDIVIEDSDASRQHVVFIRTAQGHQVQDLNTSNGTLLNGSALTETHLLQNKDVVKVGEVQVTFIQTRKDPSALGLEVGYASSLKGFTNPAAGIDPGATTLGLANAANGEFEVGAVGDYGAAADGSAAVPEAAPQTRDLDLEFNDFTPGQALPSAEDGRMSLTLELAGLSPDLQQLLQGMVGKLIELPALKIRIKSE